MTPEQKDVLIIHLLVSIQSEVQTLRDIVVSNITDTQNRSPKEKEALAANIHAAIKDKQRTTLAQIKIHYENDFGDIDDLLNQIL